MLPKLILVYVCLLCKSYVRLCAIQKLIIVIIIIIIMTLSIQCCSSYTYSMHLFLYIVHEIGRKLFDLQLSTNSNFIPSNSARRKGPAQPA